MESSFTSVPEIAQELGLDDAQRIKIQELLTQRAELSAAENIDDKPAKLIVAETMQERDALAAELEETKAAFAEPAATIENLQAEAIDLTTQLETARTEISTLREANASIDDLKARYKGSLPITWVGGALLVMLVLGFLAGLWYTDHRSRKRHGGIRIY